MSWKVLGELTEEPWGELQEWEGSVGEQGLVKSGRAQQN